MEYLLMPDETFDHFYYFPQGFKAKATQNEMAAESNFGTAFLHPEGL